MFSYDVNESPAWPMPYRKLRAKILGAGLYPDDDHDVLMRTIYAESLRTMSEDEALAIAHVVINRYQLARRHRVARTWWGGSISRICLNPTQFSCWQDGDEELFERIMTASSLEDPHLRMCWDIAYDALHRKDDPDTHTFGSTHYLRLHQSTFTIPSKWAVGKTPRVVYGDKVFYNNVVQLAAAGVVEGYPKKDRPYMI